MQTLNFIGNGSAFNTKLGNNSAFMKFGRTLFLIDCGSTTFDRLMQTDVLDNIDECHVFITHFHPDHIGSLGDLAFYIYYIKKITPKIYTPQKTSLEIIAKLMAFDNCCEIIKTDILMGSEFVLLDKKLYIIPVKVPHDENLECYGYDIVIHIPNVSTERIFYSGDTYGIMGNIYKDLIAGRIDEWYQDTSYLHYDGNVHLSLELLTEEIHKELRNKIYCMHLDSSFDRSAAESLGFSVTTNMLDK